MVDIHSYLKSFCSSNFNKGEGRRGEGEEGVHTEAGIAYFEKPEYSYVILGGGGGEREILERDQKFILNYSPPFSNSLPSKTLEQHSYYYNIIIREIESETR